MIAEQCMVGRYVTQDDLFDGYDFSVPCPLPATVAIRYRDSSIIRWCCETHFQLLEGGGVVR